MPTATATVEPVLRAYVARIDDINPRDRSLVATINTGSLDRYRTVIDPRGIDRKKYALNPVVLWMHGQDQQRGAMPIGRNDWTRAFNAPDGPSLRARTLFHFGKKDPDGFSERLFECYRDGDMAAWSVNVIPRAEGCSPPTRDEIKERPELVDCWMMYRASELGEYSAVAVGGNADTLTVDEGRGILKCVSRGLLLPADLVARATAAVGPDPAAVSARIGRDGPAYLALGPDGTEVGRHELEQAARDQVARMLADEGDGPEPEPEPAPVLPALVGRPFAARRAEVLSQLGGLFEEAKADLEMRADFRRGRV